MMGLFLVAFSLSLRVCLYLGCLGSGSLEGRVGADLVLCSGVGSIKEERGSVVECLNICRSSKRYLPCTWIT
jgi:hypothetical protein